MTLLEELKQKYENKYIEMSITIGNDKEVIDGKVEEIWFDEWYDDLYIKIENDRYYNINMAITTINLKS